MTVVAIAAKLTIYLANVAQEQMAMLTFFVNLTVVLVGSFFAVRYFKAHNPGSGLKDQVKAGMKTTTFFALMISLFVLVYYNYIDTHYFPDMISARVELAQSELENNPDIQVDKVRSTGEALFSPRTHATITLFGLTIIGAIYSFLISILMRRIPGFK